MKIKIHNKDIEFNLEDYGTHKPYDPEDDYMERCRNDAVEIICQELVKPTFCISGTRNDTAVNMCIALHVLGYNPEPWFHNFFENEDVRRAVGVYNRLYFMDHVNRIIPYLTEWGPEGAEGDALGYTL